ncbi:ATP-binding protein [Roseateles puraquae]|uniref:ATP-binding protein n=1 Tax=Roseateles puraquae TaxID=431059 RepID=UPI0031D9D502
MLPCAVLVTDGQGRVLSLNAEMREQFGLPAHPGAQRHLDDWLPLASRIFVQTHVWPLLLRQGRVNEIHLKLKGADGEARPVLLNARCLPGDAPPATTRVHWALFSAVERQRFEGELLHARQRLQNLLLSSDAGTWEWHVPTGALRVNERWAAMLGWSIAETQALDLSRRSAQLHPDERQPVAQRLEALLGLGPSEYLSEHRMRHRQGHWVWVQERGRVVSRRPDGSPEWIFGTLVDISETVAQRDAVRRSEALLRRTNDLAGVGGWELDLRTQTLFWSAQTCRIHGVPEGYQPHLDEALGFYPEGAREQIEAAVRRGTEDGSPWDLEVPFVRRDGSPLVVRALGMVDHENGAPVRMLGALQDVTEQHRLMQTLRQAKLAAESASEAKSMFLANMNHEIRTPMNAIIGIAHLLADTPLNEDQRQLLGKLQISGRALLSLIDDVLDLAKIEAGEMGIERAAYSPHDLFHEVEAVFATQAARKGLSWNLQLPAELPPLLIGDATRLRQVLSNLLSNALKFTALGGVSLVVGLEGDQLRLTVHDTGIGIPVEAQDKLFQPFAQADASTTRRFGGTGLGLFISRRLVDLMGGRMGLRSAAGEGAEFSVLLPLEAADTTVLDSSLSRSIGQAPAAAGGKRLQAVRLLVVDDSEINLEVLSRMLEREGAQVVCETSAASALARLERAERFDAVLLDIQMPDIDGLEATRRIRRTPGLAGLPVLALTAGALAEERRRALDAGMDEFLTKPVDPDKVVQALSRHLAPALSTAAIADESETVSPPLAALPVIDGLDVAEALSRLGGDLVLFHRLIARLLSTFNTAWLAGLAARSAAELQAEMHKLRGSASLLGAARVDQLAAEAEARLRQGGLPDEVRPQLDALAEALAALRDAAAPMWSLTPDRGELTAPVTLPSPEDGAQGLDLLLTLLHQQDLGAGDALAALLPWLREQRLPESELHRLSHTVAELDFEPAIEFLSAWKASSALSRSA